MRCMYCVKKQQYIENHVSLDVQKEEQIRIVKYDHKGPVITPEIWEYYIVIELNF